MAIIQLRRLIILIAALVLVGTAHAEQTDPGELADVLYDLIMEQHRLRTEQWVLFVPKSWRRTHFPARSDWGRAEIAADQQDFERASGNLLAVLQEAGLDEMAYDPAGLRLPLSGHYVSLMPIFLAIRPLLKTPLPAFAADASNRDHLDLVLRLKRTRDGQAEPASIRLEYREGGLVRTRLIWQINEADRWAD